ncbi:hypothetical protein GUITHDRAFT_146022 [Guillardia theta CCMP2712]|uniref:VDE lipocalin domain-containing protein n=1 Tax=Guillardia theta (strain CCMP2712) TaxID=905079 RepID=L1IJU5_GUITC|nr:hypothetical protein GUITHDRAFT_146022 [Guillardia theta CCMP2712]EKX36080.1 hypothetical protein GUITHDRAFT_146022 [Guillardia theta CCMP2712]|eukprot:XP_005823060.1 hypothetical protein GUITHDRAFT_146022 [Guillardia theta CCMP2712]
MQPVRYRSQLISLFVVVLSGVPAISGTADQWDLGVNTTTKFGFLSSVVYKPVAGCFAIAGKISTGFCGISEDLTPNPASGKFQKKICAPNGDVITKFRVHLQFCKSIGETFTFDSCLNKLLGSTIDQECRVIGGKFNVQDLVTQRRQVLPDCCIAYFQGSTEVCNCDRTLLSQYCSDFCCCKSVLDNIGISSSAEERLAKAQLRLIVQQECCESLLFNQCTATGDCRDENSPTKYLQQLTAFPMCCQYCYDIYDRRCSFQTTEQATGQTYFISMKSRQYLPKLKKLCEETLQCKNSNPCSSAAIVPLNLLLVLVKRLTAMSCLKTEV